MFIIVLQRYYNYFFNLTQEPVYHIHLHVLNRILNKTDN